MKIRYNNILTAVAAVLLLGACSRELPVEEGYGYLSAGVRTDSESELIVKAAQAPADDEIFSLKLLKKGTEDVVATVADYRALQTEPLKVPAGNYTVVAECGSQVNAAWDAPYYKGSQDVLVKPETVNNVDITCKLANVMVTVEMDPEMDNYFTEYRVSVDNGQGNAMYFSSDNNTVGNTAYFAATGTLRYELYLKNTEGLEYHTSRETISNVTACQHYHLKFQIVKSQVTSGASAIRLTMDDSLNDKELPLVLDFGAGAPVISATGFELNNEISVQKFSATTKKLEVSAPDGLRSLVLSQQNASLSSRNRGVRSSLKSGYELVDASSATVAELAEAGIVTASVPFGSTSASIDFTTFLSTLDLGTYNFVVTICDTKYHSIQTALNFRVISPVDAEAGSVVKVGAQYAILSGRWYTDGEPEGMALLYRKASESNWTTYTGTLDKNTNNSTFKAELWSLAANTDYVFKVVSSKDTDTRELEFKTARTETLHNFNFDLWYKDGSAWMPNESSSIQVWDSANPGTASLGVVPTTPEESDVVSGKAASLTSSTAFGQFAAGNIYIGRFGRVAGLGAELYWGVPFTTKPLAIRGWYKYTPKPIDKVKDPYKDKKGEDDSCSMLVYLTDWTGQFMISTSDKQFLSETDASIIAMGDFTSNVTTNGYVRVTVPIVYRDNRTPSYIAMAFAASRLGDYFTGGVGSNLLVDEFEFVYDPAELTEQERELVGYRQY